MEMIAKEISNIKSEKPARTIDIIPTKVVKDFEVLFARYVYTTIIVSPCYMERFLKIKIRWSCACL